MIDVTDVQFKVGQTVEVFDMGGWQNGWRRAVLVYCDKPYLNKANWQLEEQWEYRWESGTETDKETGVKPSQGGRTLERYIRPVEADRL